MIDIDNLLITVQAMLLFMNIIFYMQVRNNTDNRTWVHIARFIHPFAIGVHSTVIIAVIFV